MKISPYLVIPAVLSIAAVINPATASAHDWLVNTTPAENSTGPAPTQVAMTYNESVTHAQAWVIGPDHAVWSAGPLNGSGSDYTIALRPSPPPGEYTVHWHNTAADGDDIHSQWTFTVG